MFWESIFIRFGPSELPLVHRSEKMLRHLNVKAKSTQKLTRGCAILQLGQSALMVASENRHTDKC